METRAGSWVLRGGGGGWEEAAEGKAGGRRPQRGSGVGRGRGGGGGWEETEAAMERAQVR